MSQEKIRELELLIQKCDSAYYNEQPIASDPEYDSLRMLLASMYPESPLVNRVGSPVTGDFEKVKHPVKMYSLNDIFTEDDLRKWCAKNPGQYVAEIKLDGLAIEIEYRDGKLYRASTRGDGLIGDDVTHSVKTIKNVPLRLSQDINLIVRGEVIIPRDKFKLLSGFANARNAAAGSVRQKDASVSAQRHLAFFAYSNPFTDKSNHVATLSQLNNFGFFVVKQKVCDCYEDVIDNFKKLDAVRENLPYDIDGMVVKVLNHEQFESAGYKGRYPNAACAMKFEAPAAITKLIGIELEKGRTGVITPIAILEPVEISGSTVRRANLFNQDEIDRLGIYIGALVTVKKSGDIIPQIENVLPSDRKYTLYKMPTFCYICGESLDTSMAQYKCHNTECGIERQIIYAVGKSCLDIQGLGEMYVKQLVQEGMIKDFVDVFKFKDASFMNDVITLQGWGRDRINKIHKQVIDYHITPAKFYKTLGIPTIGEEKAKIIGDMYQNPADFIDDWTGVSLYRLKVIGDVSYRKLAGWMNVNKNLVERFFQQVTIDIVFKAKEPKTFCFSGALSMPRPQFKAIVEQVGHHFSSSITKKVDYLVVGSKTGSKVAKAETNGIMVINEEEFVRLINV